MILNIFENSLNDLALFLMISYDFLWLFMANNREDLNQCNTSCAVSAPSNVLPLVGNGWAQVHGLLPASYPANDCDLLSRIKAAPWRKQGQK